MFYLAITGYQIQIVFSNFLFLYNIQICSLIFKIKIITVTTYGNNVDYSILLTSVDDTTHLDCVGSVR